MLPAGVSITAQDVAVQPDGKVVVVGGDNSGAGGESANFVVARFKSDGTPDTSFAGVGYVRTGNVGGLGADSAHAVAISSTPSWPQGLERTPTS